MSVGGEEAKAQAVARLAFARKQHPELKRAEAEARVSLAAAIILMDETDDQVPGHHNLNEQAAVNSLTTAYAQALADLLRGEKSD